jgi:hypothetical protein
MLSKVLTALVASVVMVGCSPWGGPGKVTGGGWIEAGDAGSEKANFGFNASSCEAYEVCDGVYAGFTGNFNFNDMTDPLTYAGGVKMNGKVTGAVECLKAKEDCKYCFEDSTDGDYMIEVSYRSTNPLMRGTGKALVCVRDNGEGFNATDSDSIWIKVKSGPFDGYRSSGAVQGNIQAHTCDEEESG